MSGTGRRSRNHPSTASLVTDLHPSCCACLPIMAIVTNHAWMPDPARQSAVTPNDVAHLDTILIS
jgi:hypothetical protein